MLKLGETGVASYILNKVEQNEPITVVFEDNGKSLSSVNFDCVFRGATPESCTYEVRK